MVRDFPTQIINESIRRQINQVMNELVVEELPGCPIWHIMDPEQAKRVIAIGVVMTRITQSARWN